ncbi:MAG: DUF2061 domain-containing protein [Pseudomonadota bacterium]
MDTRARTWVKALLWNAIGLAVMSLVGFVMTGSAAIGGTMAVINTLIGLACYVMYERLWSRVRWGRVYG